ncbi:hypothetical protein Poli38472_008712 [Pythium oligandrum]|uniref:Alpha,alpha-trehalose-phosphate synthase (UDP-forming) n=1 Tax=Pythium oligandrum TaxID=41045 RepID=A0A8K1C3Y7_PYTOL|nr:hypothetical protein Poli38472_008712 [Pythium oligandrum]|eukprot:TMW56064.1 hypothetical protein Poli38472_008712 [Pythium oligandrum]
MDSDAPEERSFQEREADLLRELSSLYTKLNQVREKRAKVEQETSSAASTEDTSDRRRRRRVILVTRSLPFTLTAEDAQSQWRAEFHENLTLDAAMETYMCLHETYDCVWIGSVNGEVEQSEQNTLKEQLHQDRNYYPVFLDPKREKLFYQGFCKTILWPLFHSSPPTTEDQLISQEMDNEADERNVMEKMWQAYVAVNQSFADAVQEVYEEGDLVWIQGYHLSLVPQMVRNLFPNSNIHIGFFMHTPFPSSELYRILNYREEMLTGVLGADLIGFQTYEYARHFQSSVVRLLGLESSHKGVDVDGHFARITICPVGIDPEKFTALARSDGVNDQIRQLRAQFAGKTVMLGMDQLDPTKGLVHKLLAVEELFTLRPELSREVVFVQIVTGGTSALESPLGAQVEALVSRINSKLQDIGADAPVQYLNQELPRDMLIALYALADCIVITPVQEGMNAMPFEYVVCREAVGKHARIVLSEFAGSAHSLGGAKLVNPWNTEELHDALLASLQDSEGVMSAHQSMYSYVSTFTSRHWADNFLEQLEECCEENNLAVSGRELSRRDMTSAYTRSSRRLIFINYEGVMAAEASIPELSYPPQELIWQLSMLTDDPRNTVVLVCARSMAVCEQWFAGLSGRIVLAAEYGVYVKWIGENEPWRCVVPNLDLDWWEDVEPLLEYYTERTPGSFMERKDSSVTWHYRDCDQDHGLWQASELLISLRELTRSLPVAVVPGNRYLEVRPQKVSKASLFERIWEFMNYSSLFPNEEPVTTEYFGELARPSTSPMVKPNPGPPLSADRWRAKEKDELAKFRLEDSDRSSPWRRRTSDTNNADPADMDESSLTDEEDTIMASDQTVDFVVVIAAGEDRTDEDLFSVLVPPPIDLEAYCRQLDKDELRMEKKLSESALLAHDEELSMLNDGDSIRRRSSWNNNGLSASPTAPILGAGSLEDTTFIQLTPKSSFRRLLSRDNMLASVGSQGNVLDPELLPLARLPSQGTDGHSGKPTISDDAATMFPRALLATPATARRDEITEKSKFTPRRDFPPSAALFKAMKTKYGESFGMHKIPNTPAECWALVCPPTARAKLEDSTLDRKASVGSTSQPVAAVTVIKEVDEVLSEPEASVVVEGDDDELKVVVEKLVRVRSSSSRLDESDDVSEVERYLFPVNTFVCTLGRKLSQAPYYIKNSADLYQLLQEMGLSSHLRRQRLLSQNVGRSVSPLHGENEVFAGDEGEIEAEVALAAALAH